MENPRKKSFFKYPEEMRMALCSDFRQIQFAGEVDKKQKNRIIQEKYDELIEWLGEAPANQFLRVNTLQRSAERIIKLIQSTDSQSVRYNLVTFPRIPELILVTNKETPANLEGKEIKVKPQEAIVKSTSAPAILRGAHVFGPDIMGLSKAARKDMVISVFADITGTCKPGATTNLQKDKKFLGNGILITREYSKFRGPVIKLTERITTTPSIDLNVIPKNFVRGQQFPSIICPRILDPKPEEVILEICGYAGIETSHISALMENKGIVIALQKDKMRMDQFTKRNNDFGCKNIRIFHFDYEKLVKEGGGDKLENVNYRPPFSKGSFDRILLDADCSYLGLRPLIFYTQNGVSKNHVNNQKKLFSAAVELLKVGGVLVYSTCTVTISENEGIVAWALKTFPELELTSAREKYESFELREFPVSPGYTVDGLTHDDAEKVLRFGPGTDSAGFFIASFRKQE